MRLRTPDASVTPVFHFEPMRVSAASPASRLRDAGARASSGVWSLTRRSGRLLRRLFRRCRSARLLRRPQGEHRRTSRVPASRAPRRLFSPKASAFHKTRRRSTTLLRRLTKSDAGVSTCTRVHKIKCRCHVSLRGLWLCNAASAVLLQCPDDKSSWTAWRLHSTEERLLSGLVL